jgi:flagellar basal-body rod protein FlgG
MGLYVGLGVKVSGTQLDFAQGSPMNTNRDLDVMIDGRGFFQVLIDDELGGVGYTRAGNFALNADGEVVMANDQGRRLEPSIQVDEDVTGIEIHADGSVWVSRPGETELEQVGQIELAGFINPAGLKQIGENLYVETGASGPPIEANPGEDGLARLQQRSLESSNVNPTNELIDLIRTQRAFEMNSQSIRTADEVMRAIAQLRR